MYIAMLVICTSDLSEQCELRFSIFRTVNP